MQIGGFNKETLADGSGTAPITWIARELLETAKRMNPVLVTTYKNAEVNSFSEDYQYGGVDFYSQNRNVAGATARATFTFTATITAY